MGIEEHKHLLSKKLEKKILVSDKPQLMGSIGAALAGYEIYQEI